MDLEPLEPEPSVTPPVTTPTAPRRRRPYLAAAAAGLVAGLGGAALGTAVFAHSGRSTLTFQPAATASASTPSTPGSGAGRHHFGMHCGAGGTVTKVSGNIITLSTPGGGQATITTNAQTTYQKVVLGKVSDIKTGQTVAALGSAASNGDVSAAWIAILPSGTAPKAPPAMMNPPAGAEEHHGMFGFGHAVGTVSSVNGSSFVVSRPDGSKVTVTTSSTTKVVEQASASASDVVAGARILAMGNRNSDGSFTATRIEILPAGQTDGPVFGFGPRFGFWHGGPRAGGGPGGSTAPASLNV